MAADKIPKAAPTATPVANRLSKSKTKPERLLQGIPCEGSPYADDAPRLTTYAVVKMADLAFAFIAELEQIATVEGAAKQSLLALAAVTRLSRIASGDAGAVPFIYAINAVEKSLPKSKAGRPAKEGVKAVAAIQILVAAGIELKTAIAEAVAARGVTARPANTIALFTRYWNDRAIYRAVDLYPHARRDRTPAQARAAMKRLYRVTRAAAL